MLWCECLPRFANISRIWEPSHRHIRSHMSCHTSHTSPKIPVMSDFNTTQMLKKILHLEIFVLCEKLNIREISSWQRVGNFNQVVVKTLALDINQRSKTNLQFILSGELWQELLEHFHISWQNMTSWHDIFSVKHDQFDILISSLKIRHRWQIARQDDRFLNIFYREN